MTDTPIPLPEKQVELLFGDMRLVQMNPLAIGLNDVALTMAEIGGPQVVLETIASGRLPSEIAATWNLPQLGFRRWMQENISPVELAEAFSAGAETMVFKSTALLGLGAGSKGEAEQARLLSVQFLKLAERLDPGRWAPRKDMGAQGGMAVSIKMNFGGGRTVTAGDGARDVTPDARAESVPVSFPVVTEVQEPDIGELLRGADVPQAIPDLVAPASVEALAAVLADQRLPEAPQLPVPPPPPAQFAQHVPLASALDTALQRPASWETD